MGRDRGPKKFSFPLPRRSRTKIKDTQQDDDTHSIPSVSEWSSRHEDPSSKAHRVLGTSDALYRSTSGQTSIPASPGYMSITVSEASFASQLDDRNSVAATDHSGYLKRPAMSKRPSSNILGRTYSGDGRQGSDNSSASYRLHARTSNSTLRSHYDAKSSPLSISQQTSDSAVRDRALRRGQPPVVTDTGYGGHEASPVSPIVLEEIKKMEHRKSKPSRLDLSKLFPKPKGVDSQTHGNALLSPAKMVNSPSVMSINSEYFPRPMTREPTPQVGPNKLQKNARHHTALVPSPVSPVRKFKRDEYDNAKVHIRRPPKGVQHWFDALDQDSDESAEDTQRIHAPQAVCPNAVPKAPVRGLRIGQTSRDRATSYQDSRSQEKAPAYRKDNFALEDIVDITHLTSPSQYSVDTHHSQASSQNKASSWSKNNLQDSSILSFSSSEDETDGGRLKPHRVAVRKSLDVADYTGEIVIGQAQAYEVRPHYRKQSTGRMSTHSTSTNAATIEVMYTPEQPFPSYHYPRSSTYSGSRRSSHLRQPSVILEDEDPRPKTAINIPLSPTAQSVMSARTSASAPQPHSDGTHKLMEVTAEEEALLEMMRKKRAAMNKQCAPQVDRSTREYRHQQKTPLESSQPSRRTSGFLSTSLESSPVRVVESRTKQRAPSHAPSPLLLPPRGRSTKAVDNVAMSHLRDSSVSDACSDRHDSSSAHGGKLPHCLSTPADLSPLDPFPPCSPTLAASAASPTTTDHPSPLPSPMTPGLRVGEKDIAVKVASSDTSNEMEYMPMPENGVIGAPSDNTKSDSAHRRRRTASSDADITFPTPPSSTSFKDLASVSESSSRPPSIKEPPMSRLAKKPPRHISEVAVASFPSRSRQSSVHSTGSRTSAYSQASSYLTGTERKRSRHMSRDNSIASNRRPISENRDSVSDDVLAAWGSLGGTY
ncbi:hypothetical protein BDW02DRAFT_498475 [Decorospora gaudefroyi]|uniref:Uncharacterized protein n=1 Tax=Decorospora gaudefroyi TaxID=184978 RepID=A0A6A5KDE1_9PLEO|nr:hypothetical protein BDW02DRAFT_498475 [Decorospora gaudefroyi]